MCAVYMDTAVAQELVAGHEMERSLWSLCRSPLQRWEVTSRSTEGSEKPVGVSHKGYGKGERVQPKSLYHACG